MCVCMCVRACTSSWLRVAAIDMLQGTMMNGSVKDEAEISALIAELKA